MKISVLGTIALGAVLSLLPTLPAKAQSLKDQLVGTWSMDSNVEEYTDGKKVPWDANAKGMVMFDSGGRFTLMLAEVGIRKMVEGNPAANPVGKMISYFGTYAVNEADKTLTYKIVGGSFPAWDGTEQKRLVTTIDAGKLVYKAVAPLPSAAGPFVPVLTFSRMK